MTKFLRYADQRRSTGRAPCRRHIWLIAAAMLTLAASTPHRAQAEITFLNNAGIGLVQFPSGVDVSPAGDVYVTDTGSNELEVFDHTGTTHITTLGSAGSADGQFSSPFRIRFDSSGNYFVADSFNNRIQKFDGSDTHLLSFGSFGTNDGDMNLPTGAVVGPSSKIFVADAANNRIQVFDSSANHLVTLGGTGSGTSNTTFDLPQDVGFGSTDKIYVADSNNHRVQIYTYTDGTDSFTHFATIGITGVSSSSLGLLSFPGGVGVAANGDVYVADSSNNRIQRFRNTGAFEAAFGSMGSGDGQFSSPQGVSVRETGEVYVADTNNSRIQRWFDSEAWVSGTNTFATAAVGSGELLDSAFTLAGPMTLNVTGLTTITSSGMLTIDSGAFTAGGGLQIDNGGRLGGNGTVGGNTTNDGTITPGTSSGELDVTGIYTQNSTGVLAIDIGGTGGGQFDVLDVSGTAVLGGTLDIDLAITPDFGDTFAVLTAASRSGTFDTIDGAFYTAGLLNAVMGVEYLSTGVMLEAALAGDANRNGQVEISDVLEIAANFNSTGVSFGQGDLNLDGIVDIADTLEIAANFGNVVPAMAGGITPLPEPATWLLALLAAIAAAGRRRSR